MKKIILSILTFFATTSLVFGASNLWEHYQEQGLKFPSFGERKDFYEIKTGETYYGTANQNENYLKLFGNQAIKLGTSLRVLLPSGGGTGTGTPPSYGQMLVGNSGGTYTLTATSSLGIATLSGGSANLLTYWTSATGVGATSSPTVGYITATSTTATSTFAGAFSVGSTTPAGNALFSVGASSPLFFVDKNTGNVGVGTAAPGATGLSIGDGTNNIRTRFYTTQNRYVEFYGGAGNDFYINPSFGVPTLGFNNPYFGINDGTPEARLEVSGDASGNNLFMLSSNDNTDGDYFIVNGTGNVGIGTTSPYAKLSVVGETVSSYFTATSTTATSTFPYLSVTANSNLGTVVGGTWQGTAIGDAYLTKSGDWTGTIDSNNFAGGAIGAGELIYGGSAGSFS